MNKQLLSLVVFFAVTSQALLKAETNPSMLVANHKEVSPVNVQEQFRAKAIHFSQQAANFQEKARTEKLEWDNLRQVKRANYKWPSPDETAHSLYNYYAYKAEKMTAKAAEYQAKSVNQ